MSLMPAIPVGHQRREEHERVPVYNLSFYLLPFTIPFIKGLHMVFKIKKGQLISCPQMLTPKHTSNTERIALQIYIFFLPEVN